MFYFMEGAAMFNRNDGALPDDHESTVRWERVISFWNDLRVSDKAGETSWEVLENLEREVSECRGQVPPDIGRAESITAKAFFLTTGQCDL
jgi:hypothetical protein